MYTQSLDVFIKVKLLQQISTEYFNSQLSLNIYQKWNRFHLEKTNPQNIILYFGIVNLADSCFRIHLVPKPSPLLKLKVFVGKKICLFYLLSRYI